MPGEYQTISVGGSDMRSYVHLPDGAAGVPAVVVLHGTNGMDAGTEKAAVDRLAAEGIAAIVPDLFHRGLAERAEGAPRSGSMRAADFVADAQAGLDHLRASGVVAPERIGIMGFCMGGLVTYLVSGYIADLRAAVAFYPSYVFRPLGGGEDPSPFDVTGDIACPLIIFAGDDDTHPSPDDLARIDAELTRLGKVHEIHTYPDTAHAFMSETSDSYREHAAKDAWPRAVDWLKHYL